MGVVKTGVAGRVQFVSGTLNVGEASSPPVIRAAKQAAPPADWTILDAPPGTACSMIETVRDCDYVLLVTEPTPFGLHDLRLALEVAQTLNRPCGVVVNRAQPGVNEARELCAQAGVPILAEIPDALAIAKAYSQGQLVVEAVPELQPVFDQLLQQLASLMSRASPIYELVVLSGKGGTGKTSVTASLAALTEKPALADCDVDASNLPLVLDPRPRRREGFTGGLSARIRPGHCTACGKCEELCRFDAILFDGPGNGRVPRTFRVDRVRLRRLRCVRPLLRRARHRIGPRRQRRMVYLRHPVRPAGPCPPAARPGQFGQAGHARPRAGAPDGPRGRTPAHPD